MKNITSQIIPAFKIMGVFTIISTILLVVINGGFDWDQLKIQCLYNFYYGIPLSLVNGYLFDKLGDFVSWEENPKKRVVFGIISSVIVTMIALVILNYLLWVLYMGNDPSIVFSNSNKPFYLIAMGITFGISMVMYLISFYKVIQDEKIISERLRKEKVEAELSALKAHVDPHFLFNSFNILSGMIDEDPKKAQKLLKQLSNIYRYILENKAEDTNTIAEELNFSKMYLNFQQARFEDSITLDINIDDSILEKKIPVLTLQLLLENAIKHNAFDESNPLKIEIYKDDNHLIVKTI